MGLLIFMNNLMFIGGLVFVLLIVVLVVLLRNLLKPHYSANRFLMTRTERLFYAELIKQVGSSYHVFTKVRIADILTTNKTLIKSVWWRRFIKISSKHVDFVLCDSKDLSIVCCIELDDKSHNTRKVKKRDHFVNKIFKEAELKLIRMPVSNHYKNILN